MLVTRRGLEATNIIQDNMTDEALTHDVGPGVSSHRLHGSSFPL
jgi:hypothetical protein